MEPIVVYRGEDGYWVSECPILPGCISQGEMYEEAVRNIKEAIGLYIDVLTDDGLPILAKNDLFDML